MPTTSVSPQLAEREPTDDVLLRPRPARANAGLRLRWLALALLLAGSWGVGCKKSDEQLERESRREIAIETLRHVRAIRQAQAQVAAERQRLLELGKLLRQLPHLPRSDAELRTLERAGRIPPTLTLDIWGRPRYCLAAPRRGARICSLGADGKKSLDDHCVEISAHGVELYP